jgi:hypothetical protein
LVFIDIDCDSEICNLNLAFFGYEYIQSLDIPMDDIEFMQILQSLQNLKDIEFDESFRKNGPLTQHSQCPSLQILEYQIYLMVFDDSIKVLDNILMVEILDEVDFLLDGLDLLLADGHLFHGHEHSVVEIDALMHQAVCALADRLDYLVALYYLVFVRSVHEQVLTAVIFISIYTIFELFIFLNNIVKEGSGGTIGGWRRREIHKFIER